ncbi:MAG: HD domain-containing protein [Clostridia bacterium]|nr:HD domain-containing protein [Clostridia bacterium]
MNIIKQIEKEVKEKINEYKDNAEDHYDFWNEHIKYVYIESQKLARQYSADIEIVKLGALLHDIALICKVGERKDHHINGKILAEEILKKYDYPKEKMDRVLSCVYNHRSSKNARSIEDLCVADADIIAHFDNIPMLFNSAYNRNNINLNEVRDWLKEGFEKDYNDLSDRTKESFKEQYKLICKIVLGDE